MEKKLIGFTDELIERINAYANSNNTNFTDAVRSLVELALNSNLEEITNEAGEPFQAQLNELKEKVEKLSWWTTDDNTSRLGNLEVEVKEMDKKLNIVVAISKKLKGHLNNTEIHLQD
jgi:hypothetical protein